MHPKTPAPVPCCCPSQLPTLGSSPHRLGQVEPRECGRHGGWWCLWPLAHGWALGVGHVSLVCACTSFSSPFFPLPHLDAGRPALPFSPQGVAWRVYQLARIKGLSFWAPAARGDQLTLWYKPLSLRAWAAGVDQLAGRDTGLSLWAGAVGVDELDPRDTAHNLWDRAAGVDQLAGHRT